MPPPKIAHIIADLNGFGGTEATLLRYLKKSSIPIESQKVFVLKSIGTGNTLGAQMVDAGIRVVALGEKGRRISLESLVRLYRELASFDPDVVSGWLYHPSLLASALSPFLKRRPRIVWHIRSSTFSSIRKTPGRFVVQRLLAIISRFSRPVFVSNSETALREHAGIGFNIETTRSLIIHNGIDDRTYHPNDVQGAEVRREIDVPENAILLGCVGRFVAEKGYSIFFEALTRVYQDVDPQIKELIFVVAMGDGVLEGNQEFFKLIPLDIPLKQVRLLGKRGDVARLLRSLDIYVLPSLNEAFPNSLVEAMATGVACVSTSVGECEDILVKREFLAPAGDVEKLAECIRDLVIMTKQQRTEIGIKNREQVKARFDLLKMVTAFDSLFFKLCDNSEKNLGIR